MVSDRKRQMIKDSYATQSGVSGKTGVLLGVCSQSQQQSSKEERRNDRRHPQNYSIW